MKQGRALILFLIPIILIIGYILYTINWNIVNDKTKHNISYTKVDQQGAQLKQDPHLLLISSELGINVSDLNLAMVDTLPGTGYSQATGVFISPNTISIKKGQSIEDTRKVFAHEYAHYVYSRSVVSKETIENNYNIYLNDSWLNERLNQYKDCDKLCISDEVHSYSCTTTLSNLLDEEYNNYCNSIIPNRSLLF